MGFFCKWERGKKGIIGEDTRKFITNTPSIVCISVLVVLYTIYYLALHIVPYLTHVSIYIHKYISTHCTYDTQGRWSIVMCALCYCVNSALFAFECALYEVEHLVILHAGIQKLIVYVPTHLGT